MIGLLFGFREICISLMEIPTGAIADVLGRRRAMVCSHLAYIGSFLIFGLSEYPWLLFAAMLLFSIGETFRTGTHKAMIFDWLAHQDRQWEKTKIYGFTRSWSKLGSALSVVISALLVFTTGQYSYIFLFSIGPYIINIFNFLTYPTYLDGPGKAEADFRSIMRVLFTSLRDSMRIASMRRLFIESMGFEGGFKVCKDYIQPVLKAAALSLPLFASLAGQQRTAVLIGLVYFLMYLLASYASRHAGAFVARSGSEARSTRILWILNFAVFALMTAGILMKVSALAIVAFVCLFTIQNLWRPILISRFVGYADPEQTATVLSIESQGKAIFGAIIAPLLGLAVDYMTDGLEFLPVALLGLVIAAIMLVSWPKMNRHEPSSQAAAGLPDQQG